MMNLGRIWLILIIFSLFLSTSPGIAQSPVTTNQVDTNQGENMRTDYFGQSIQAWRADPSKFNITNAKIFPQVIISPNGGFSDLGKAWVTWTVQINDGRKLAFFTIYDRGNFKNFTLINEGFREVYWFGIQSQLFFIGSTASKTYIKIYSANNPTRSFTIDKPSTNHQLYVSQNEIIGYVELEGQPTYLSAKGLSLTQQNTSETMHDVGPQTAIIEGKSQIRKIYTPNGNYTIPSNFSDDISLGHFLLQPTVFDFKNDIAWSPTNTSFDLPKNSEKLHLFGLASSIVELNNGSLVEYNGNRWNLVGHFNVSVIEMSIIDIGLYVGTTSNQGLAFLTSGFDEDNDGLPDTMEDYYGTLSTDPDTDDDGLTDFIEVTGGTNPRIYDLQQDYDRDGLTNIEEYERGLSPQFADTDFGGAIDGWEIKHEFDPLNRDDDTLDPDNDGVINAKESRANSSPYKKDTDGDKLPDAWEIKFGLDPTDPSDANADPDGDGRTNYEEYLRGTDPLHYDQPRVFSGNLFLLGTIFIICILASYVTLHTNIIEKVKENLIE